MVKLYGDYSFIASESGERSLIRGSLKGLRPFKNTLSPSPYSGIVVKGVLEGRSPSKETTSPFPFKGKGDKGG